MPVNMVTGTEEWIPFGPALRKGAAEIGKRKLAHDLIKALPQMIADAVNKVDGCELTDKEVITVVNTFHPWSNNVPGIWIDVQPGTKDKSWAENKERRDAIRGLLQHSIWHYLGSLESIATQAVPLPALDIEVRPLSGSGVSTDNTGTVVQSW